MLDLTAAIAASRGRYLKLQDADYEVRTPAVPRDNMYIDMGGARVFVRTPPDQPGINLTAKNEVVFGGSGLFSHESGACAILAARGPGGQSAGYHSFNNIRTQGRWGVAGVVVAAAELCRFRDCLFQSESVAPALYIGNAKPAGISVPTGNQTMQTGYYDNCQYMNWGGGPAIVIDKPDVSQGGGSLTDIHFTGGGLGIVGNARAACVMKVGLQGQLMQIGFHNMRWECPNTDFAIEAIGRNSPETNLVNMLTIDGCTINSLKAMFYGPSIGLRTCTVRDTLYYADQVTSRPAVYAGNVMQFASQRIGGWFGSACAAKFTSDNPTVLVMPFPGVTETD